MVTHIKISYYYQFMNQKSIEIRDSLKEQAYLEKIEPLVNEIFKKYKEDGLSVNSIYGLVHKQVVDYLENKTKKPYLSEKLATLRTLMADFCDTSYHESRRRQDVGITAESTGKPKCAAATFVLHSEEIPRIVGCMFLNSQDPNRVDEVKIYEIIREDDEHAQGIAPFCRFAKDESVSDNNKGPSGHCILHDLPISVVRELDLEAVIREKYDEIVSRLDAKEQKILKGKIDKYIDAEVAPIFGIEDFGQYR